ncbi:MULTISPECIES: PEP/pyruvate-binding domain-containing protein [unclassified Bradyrhizobium]|nr:MULTISPECIES: PEP/pyruvate-binding domain-containing protein [unclassified Bradyrhizobium]
MVRTPPTKRPGTVRFGTKAETLVAVRERAETFTVLPIVRIEHDDWTRDRSGCVDRILEHLDLGRSLIVRSSFSSEDGNGFSYAGRYRSVLNVRSRLELDQAIESVFSSYETSTTTEHLFIQPMATDVVLSGVIMTADPQTGAPYTIINYATGADTEIVTRGSGITKTHVLFAKAKERLPYILSPLKACLIELEELFSGIPIDVEFAITEHGKVVVFQVRPIAQQPDCSLSDVDGFEGVLDQVSTSYRNLVRHFERKQIGASIFGVMTDWNPAELIGLKPRPLAYSLYRSLVTDGAWSEGRARLGYHDMHPHGLMSLIGGIPYVNVSLSFHSLVPGAVPPLLRHAIVRDACDNLSRNPHNHDKVEFAVIPTAFKPALCRTEWRDRFPSLVDQEWDDYKQALLTLTNDIIKDGAYGRVTRQIESVERIYLDRVDLASADFLEVKNLLARIRQVAMPLFSSTARAAFIATDILKCSVEEGLLPATYIDTLSIMSNCVGSQMVEDFETLAAGPFLERYGHIRPGTFEITVPRYDAAASTYFGDGAGRTKATETRNSRLSGSDVSHLNSMFRALGYAFDWNCFESFAIKAIHDRERVKFLYSKALSDALEIIGNIGARHGFGRETMSFLTVSDIENIVDLVPDPRSRISELESANRAAWHRFLPVRLPELLLNENDIYSFDVRDASPNFITDKTLQGEIAETTDSDLTGRVVFIERADPGFDWLFTRPVAGFVTKYGGENSHMAIRAREFNVPAVIGAGKSFDDWKRGKMLRIECGAKRVEVLW